MSKVICQKAASPSCHASSQLPVSLSQRTLEDTASGSLSYSRRGQWNGNESWKWSITDCQFIAHLQTLLL